MTPAGQRFLLEPSQNTAQRQLRVSNAANRPS